MRADFKSGFVAIIGRPNVGKSTLMNHLIGQKIAITSRKPQTTRNKIQTVYTGEKGQIVFLDTPGIHKAKNKLGEYMVNVAQRTFKDADVILWLVEPTSYIGAGERHIAEQLKNCKLPVILVINKVDTVKKSEIAGFIDGYRKLYNFSDIVPASALRAQNLDTVLDCIFKYLPYGPMFYDEDTITDQPQRQIVAEMIREKALRTLDEEIPHGIAVTIDQMKERTDKMKELLVSKGVKSATINLGGNVLCIGKKTDNTPFRIGIQKPFADRSETIAILDIEDKSVVSSGIYERYFEKDGTFYHHILNPDTGYPYDNHLVSVTIISDQSMDGDGLSTSCFALGLEKGMELINSLPDVHAVFITDDYQLHYSDHFQEDLKVTYME